MLRFFQVYWIRISVASTDLNYKPCTEKKNDFFAYDDYTFSSIMFRLDSMHNAYEHLVGRIAATSYESAQLQPIQWLYFENNFAILFGIKYRHFSIVVNNFYSDFIWIDILTVICTFLQWPNWVY